MCEKDRVRAVQHALPLHCSEGNVGYLSHVQIGIVEQKQHRLQKNIEVHYQTPPPPGFRIW